MKCSNSNCNNEIQSNWKMCPFCETPIRIIDGITPPGGIIDSVVKADNVHIGDQHIHQAPDPTIRQQKTGTGMLCPVCHRLAKDEWFECPECKNKYICSKHQDPKTYKCSDCTTKSNRANIAKSGEIEVGATLVDRYKIESFIGEGGMGTVYKAVDKRLDRVVAIKCLTGSGSEENEGIDRFMQEAKSIAKLSHLNIVQVYDVSTESQIPFICMELLEGIPLDELIKEKSKFTIEEVIPFLKGIGNALHYAHKRQVIHRDIKPSNIILTNENNYKLLDFGLARVGQSSDLSMSGYGMGTEAYASPEQTRDAKTVDYRTDIYSLGATIYEMLLGQSPRYPLYDMLPIEISGVVQKAMHPLLEQRYFTVEDFVKDFESKVIAPIKVKSPNAKMIIGQCIECDYVNDTADKYCEECGASLFENCANCNKESRIGKIHCSSCGVSIKEYKLFLNHSKKGKEYLNAFKFSRAVKEFKLAIEVLPSDKEVKRLLDESLEKYKNYNDLIALAEQEIENENFETADKLYRKAVQTSYKVQDLNAIIASIPEKKEDKRIRELNRLASEAKLKVDQNECDEAIVLYKRALGLCIDSEQIQAINSQIALVTEKSELQEKIKTNSLESKKRDDFRKLIKLALSNLTTNGSHQAINNLMAAFTLCPNDIDGLRMYFLKSNTLNDKDSYKFKDYVYIQFTHKLEKEHRLKLPISESVYVVGGSLDYNNKTYSIPSIYIDKTPVTIGQYCQVLKLDKQKVYGSNTDKHPAYRVTILDIAIYCNKRSKIEGLKPYYNISLFSDKISVLSTNGYRLPTTEEWLFAASGGNNVENYKYSGSDNLEEVGWFTKNTIELQDVAQKKPNQLGLYDMSGNILELCVIDSQLNPLVALGGLYNQDANRCEIFANPIELDVLERGSFKERGFRVCRNA